MWNAHAAQLRMVREAMVAGFFTEVSECRVIEHSINHGRNVSVEFLDSVNGVTVRETFDAESEHDVEIQRKGWQAILDNFARHVETRH